MTEIKGDIRIVIASGVRGDTRRYRTFHLYEQCQLLGLNVHLAHVTELAVSRNLRIRRTC